MESRLFKYTEGESQKCRSCNESLDELHPQCLPYTGNCKNCGNFVVFTSKPVKVLSQAIKEESMAFRPEINMHKMLTSQVRQVNEMGLNVISGKFNKQCRYLEYRSLNIKDLFEVAARFSFKAATVHLAVGIYDHFLQVDAMIDRLRTTYASCNNVVSS